MIETFRGKCSIRRGGSSLWIPAAVLVIMLILATAASLYFNADRIAAYGENTSGTYTLSNGDTIQYCTTSQCSGGGNQFTNTFASGATVYVKVHTTRVNSGTGYLYLYRSNVNAVPPASGYSARNLVWTRAGSDYYSSVTIPATQNFPFRIYGKIINGGNQVTFEDEIEVSTQPARYMNFYWTGPQSYPPNSADESYTFRSGATVYVQGYGTANNVITGYSTNSLKNIVTGASTPLTMGSYSRISSYYHRYTLTLPASGLTDGQWYSINSHLQRSSTTLVYDQSRLILIDDSAPNALIDSPAASSYVKGMVPVIGTADDAYSYYKYVLDYTSGGPWTTIDSQTNMPPVVSGTLGNWDTTGLTDGQLYTLRLTVTDRAGNPGNSTVVLRQVYVDNNPPVISGVAATAISSAGATINWSTDEVSSSQVRYGTSPGSYTDSQPITPDPTMVTAHSQTLSNLQPSTTYYYQVLSTDNGGNQSISSEYSFRTANITVLQPFPASGRDTVLSSAQPTWNWGAATTMSVGDNRAGGLDTLRGAIRFDLSGIPATATIRSANLFAYQMGQGDTNTQTLNLHYLTHDWSEGSLTGSAPADGTTWNTHDGTNSWTTAGGDFNPAFSSSVVAQNSTAMWTDWDITALTQSWTNLSLTNYGAIIRRSAENPAGNDAKSYYTSDYTTDPSLRPKLVIEWFGNDTTPPAIGEVRAENVTLTSANIKWSTDEQANSQIEYGTTTTYGSPYPGIPDPAMVNQHSVVLSGLIPNTVYHYHVKSTDLSGNTTVSGDYVFQTATLITIQPAPVQGLDTWVTSAGPALNYGGATNLVIGNQNTGSDNSRSLLRFDLSAIPVGSTINSATMSLYQYDQLDTSTPQLGVYYAARSWAEGTRNGIGAADGATWNTYDGINSWTSAGGDFNGTAQSVANARNSSGWVDFTITGLARNWVSGTLANEGMFVKKTAEDLSVDDCKTFYSSDYLGDSSLRPKLVVEYVPAPGSMTLTVSETYNRDASPGGGSVGFGTISPGAAYDVGEGGPPLYAVKLQIKSNTAWGLKVAATGDLVQTNLLNTIAIANLKWKQDAEAPASYHSMDTADTTILSGQPATDNYPFFFDYRLTVPVLAVSGSYSTTIVYTAYPS